LPALLLLGAVACLAVAFAQFRVSQHVEQATILLVMDASNSMNETDVAPSRLAAAQDAARAFLDRLPPRFRVGLVTFAGEADVRVAPTTDRGQVAASLGAITTSAGTVIGDGLAAALESLQDDWRANDRGPAAVLLLSDGRDTGSEVPPTQAADRAATLGVPVFTVVLGTVEGASGSGGANADLLRLVASSTGGEAFTAASAEELTGVYESLGSGLSTELAVSDIGVPFLIAAGVLALLAGWALVRGTQPVDWR
jgi:Ca-activated chloride channel family protein